jgi:hypothetical protein
VWILQVLGGVICVVAALWIISTATTWLLDRGKIARAPLFDGTGIASPARQKDAYDRNVDVQHRLYLRLRRRLPWAVVALIIGIGLGVIGSH